MPIYNYFLENSKMGFKKFTKWPMGGISFECFTKIWVGILVKDGPNKGNFRHDLMLEQPGLITRLLKMPAASIQVFLKHSFPDLAIPIFSFAHAALLVLLPAATGARVVTPYFGLVVFDGFRPLVAIIWEWLALICFDFIFIQ